MKTIHKYPIQLTDAQWVKMPAQAEILSVGMQNGVMCLWAIVDPVFNTRDDKYICIVGTGNPFDGVYKKFIGTVFDRDFVWHVFEC